MASHLIAQQLPEDPRNAEGAACIPPISDEQTHFPWGRPCLSRKCSSGRQQMALEGLQSQGGTASATAWASWWPGIRGRCDQLAEIPVPATGWGCRVWDQCMAARRAWPKSFTGHWHHWHREPQAAWRGQGSWTRAALHSKQAFLIPVFSSNCVI